MTSPHHTANPNVSMPLVKIDIVKDRRTPDQVKKLADTVQEVLITKFNAPTRDRYQVGSMHWHWLLLVFY